MQRISGLVVAAVLVSTVSGGPTASVGALMISHENSADATDDRGVIDVPALLNAARGAPPLICALAAQTVRGFGWGDWSDAPSTPLGSLSSVRSINADVNEFSTSDTELLLAGLASDDACVREISVRVLGRIRTDAVVTAFLSRLSAPSAPLREVAALGLGMVHNSRAVDPLVRSLRDPAPGVRANAAWALGRTDDGRALAPLLSLFRDDVEKVREASVIAVGKLDSSTAVSA
ncbi:MAG TPA: HEAT repeat domain-containing protein, partial [Gemmatimonadaceae bacterium]